ncbi:hypothetical protein [Nocardioides sp. InS609-2]|uniref:hypothetical protein n=1 Tax=Nocardioides sp. InS609-2 TaxID=2760705 RepID=UPI0020BE4FBF|nr:hypothetical protein [Nocardioides sp. InS609-2]
MARRTIHLHVDFSSLDGDVITDSLMAHREHLKGCGFKVPVKESDQPFLAAIEMRRDHKTHDLKRSQVEGAWAEICRRAHQGRKTPLVSVPGFGTCTPTQVDLLLDSLAGLRVHLVATVPSVASPEAAETVDHTLAHWRSQLARGRVTTVPVAPGDWRQAWQEYVAAVGLGADPLPLVDVRSPISA